MTQGSACVLRHARRHAVESASPARRSGSRARARSRCAAGACCETPGRARRAAPGARRRAHTHRLRPNVRRVVAALQRVPLRVAQLRGTRARSVSDAAARVLARKGTTREAQKRGVAPRLDVCAQICALVDAQRRPRQRAVGVIARARRPDNQVCERVHRVERRRAPKGGAARLPRSPPPASLRPRCGAASWLLPVPRRKTVAWRRGGWLKTTSAICRATPYDAPIVAPRHPTRWRR